MSPDAKKPVSPLTGEAAKAHAERMTDLFRGQNKKLRTWLRQKASPGVADDIADEAFRKVSETDSRSIGNLTGYLYETARHLRANYYRDREKHRSKLKLLQLEMKSQSSPSPEMSLIEKEPMELLNKTIGELPARCRMAFELHLEGQSNRQIIEYFASRGIRIKAWTVRRDINRGYETCRQALEASEEPKQERNE
jgi:RNA polymerase sigma-70 factor (ECF subfamily)